MAGVQDLLCFPCAHLVKGAILKRSYVEGFTVAKITAILSLNSAAVSVMAVWAYGDQTKVDCSRPMFRREHIS